MHDNRSCRAALRSAEWVQPLRPRCLLTLSALGNQNFLVTGPTLKTTLKDGLCKQTQLKTECRDPFRMAGLETSQCFMRLLLRTREVSRCKFFLNSAIRCLGRHLGFSSAPKEAQRQDRCDSYGMGNPFESAVAKLRVPSARHPISVRIMVRRNRP